MALVDMADRDSVSAPTEARALVAWTYLLPCLRAIAFCLETPVGLTDFVAAVWPKLCRARGFGAS